MIVDELLGVESEPEVTDAWQKKRPAAHKENVGIPKGKKRESKVENH